MIDHVAAVAADSSRFALALARARAAGDPTTITVPSCPGWSLDDLTWHLTEVQHFWAAIVADRSLEPSGYERPDRPESADLPGLFDETSHRLVTALTGVDPDERCWSWHAAGRNVGWVRRRQAHEALIHRVDAELAAAAAVGSDPTDAVEVIDPELAADGIDELLRVMLDPGAVTGSPGGPANGPTVSIQAVIDGDRAAGWMVRLRPRPGSEGGVVEVVDDDVVTTADATVRGPASELDLWLWRRSPLHRSTVEGDRAAIDQLWELASLD